MRTPLNWTARNWTPLHWAAPNSTMSRPAALPWMLAAGLLIATTGCTDQADPVVSQSSTGQERTVSLPAEPALVGAPITVRLPGCNAVDLDQPRVTANISLDGTSGAATYDSVVGTDSERTDSAQLTVGTPGPHTISATCYPYAGDEERYAGAQLEVGYGNALTAGGTLGTNARLESADGRYRLVMQPDGNLVQIAPDGLTTWDSGTGGNPGAVVRLGTDGNLVVAGANGVPLWTSNTGGNPGARLDLQPDGNLILRSSQDAPLWATGPDRLATVPAAATGDVLAAGQALAPGTSLTSASGRYHLDMQPDGNLVLYDGSQSLWMTSSGPATRAFLTLQPDGNLVVRARSGQTRWASLTTGATSLAVQNDGNLVLRAGDQPLWMTGPRS